MAKRTLMNQRTLDSFRKIYRVTFPHELTDERLQAWLRSIGSNLRAPGLRLVGVPTIVFEMRATPRGIFHFIRIAESQANFIIGQLRTHVPGIKVEPIDDLEALAITSGAEVGLSDGARTLRITKASDLAAGILGSVQALRPDEVVVHQWVLSHSDRVKYPSKDGYTSKSKFSVWNALTGNVQANNDEVADRRTKLDEQNFSAIGRIGAVASDPARAEELTRNLIRALAGANSNDTYFYGRAVKDISERINGAPTPLLMTAQFTISELSAVIGWPIGSPFVAGLPSGSTRHLPATEQIARDGRIYGNSNFPGDERTLAVSVTASCRHCYLVGTTGVGKTSLFDHLATQDMEAGRGVIVLEAKGDLFYKVLAHVPRHRINDVIILDVNETSAPVGFNLLDQGNPRVVVDQITDLFEAMYTDTRGVWVRELLFHGLYTLVEHQGLTFMDLPALISPKDAAEARWATEIKAGVKDKELKKFWARWDAMKPPEQQRASDPLHNRVWQLISRPELRYVIGQSTSSFQMSDVIRQNKILLINLSGVPKEAANMAGTLFMNAIWQAAKTAQPANPNFLYMDEFQSFTRGLPMGLEDMLAKARSFKLSMNMANQHYGQLPREMQSAIRANAVTKIIMQPSPEDAAMLARDLGSDYVSERDLLSLQVGEAVARLATDRGASSPVTLITKEPHAGYGLENLVLATSRSTYGRPVEIVEHQMETRRSAKRSPKYPRVGYVEDEDEEQVS